MKHTGKHAVILQQSSLKVVGETICSKLNNKDQKKVTDKMLCAGYGPCDRRIGCHGDSGGPFVCQGDDGKWVLHGAVSWGSSKCDSSQAYTVFAKVAKYVPWIESYVKRK